MAAVATGFLVLAIEGEMRFLVMVKVGFFPALVVVASFAFVAQTALVPLLPVVFAVAGNTLGLQLVRVQHSLVA